MDGNPVATGTGGYTLVDLPTANGWNLGDGTGGADADWDIDYVRWTDAGAYAVPEPATLGLLSLGGLFLRRRNKGQK